MTTELTIHSQMTIQLTMYLVNATTIDYIYIHSQMTMQSTIYIVKCLYN